MIGPRGNPTEFYEAMQVCNNGHIVTHQADTHPDELKEYCTKCGAKTTTTCESCGKSIKGAFHTSGGSILLGPKKAPNFCEYCGKSFPWDASSKSSEEASKPPSALELAKNICAKLHAVATQLLQRHDSRETLKIGDEYDAQDLLHALLKVQFDDVRPETWTPDYAGKSSRIDFRLKSEKIAIEVKKTRKNLGTKEVGDELIIDIERYRKDPECNALICLVYDPEGIIGNPSGLERDLSRDLDGFKVEVMVVPKIR